MSAGTEAPVVGVEVPAAETATELVTGAGGGGGLEKWLRSGAARASFSAENSAARRYVC